MQSFLASGSSDDFAPIVDQYLNLVYSTARKMSSADGGQLEDICQTVFADLARKARQIPEQTPLSGWLYRHTCFVASNHNRSERRRRERERQALEMSESKCSPDVPNEELHLAMTELRDQDRDALVLRFMDEWDLRRVGERLGISEDAAQKRVSRALDKLRAILGRKGITTSTAALALCLGQQVAAAPIAAKSVAIAAVSAGTSLGLSPVLAKAAAVVLLGGGVAVSMHSQNRQIAALEKQNTDLAAKATRMEQLQVENKRLIAQGLDPDEIASLRKKAAEVHALRAQMDRLRRQIREPSGTPPNSMLPVAAEEQKNETLNPQTLFTAKIIARDDDAPNAKLPLNITSAPGSTRLYPGDQAADMIKAFESEPGFSVVSAPRVVTLDGQEAQFEVVESKTVVTGYYARSDGIKFDLVSTNFMAGIRIDITGTRQSAGTHTKINFRRSSFDGYLPGATGLKRREVWKGIWFHETVPIVDLAQMQTSFQIPDGQTMLLHAKSDPIGRECFLFLTPTPLDKSMVASAWESSRSAPPTAPDSKSELEAIRATPAKVQP